ncbi:S-layer homology domain-containing protein, partial [Candidatus Gracilibacteria bacterium]|nr:S-layer homology domain-containing protein [Candidatus Gracilibacteria bacterium]
MLFKKISALVLSLSLVLSSVPSTQAAIFDDVSVSDWFHPFTEQLGAAGIVSTSNGHFYPYRPITRAELAKMVVNTASFQGVVNIASSASVSFCDVDASHWAARFINTLAQTNAVQGQAANCAQGRVFLPDNRVTRAEALKILLGVYAISVRDRGTSFSDVDNNTWYAPFVSQ